MQTVPLETRVEKARGVSISSSKPKVIGIRTANAVHKLSNLKIIFNINVTTKKRAVGEMIVVTEMMMIVVKQRL